MEETKKLLKLIAIGEESVSSLAKKIGISRVTLYTRFEKNNWKLSEKKLIETF